MTRELCVCLNFLMEPHRLQIQQAAKAAGFTAHFFGLGQLEEAKTCVQRCEVLYAHSPELLRAAPKTLQWFCCAFAGVEPYCGDETLFANPACALTNSAGAYGLTISEHLLMVTLMLMRQMPAYTLAASRREWAEAMPVRSIHGGEFLLLGTGDIGTTFAQRLRALGAASITGVNRSGRSPSDVFDRVVPMTQLDEVLPQAHVLAAALPATAETAGLLNRARIALLPQDALVLNVGRGALLDQEALADALNTGRIAGAALDVMVPEPLPPNHPLWTAKNLLLTPHVSGNMSLGYTRDRTVALFCEDLARYAAGKPLANLVDRTLGY